MFRETLAMQAIIVVLGATLGVGGWRLSHHHGGTPAAGAVPVATTPAPPPNPRLARVIAQVAADSAAQRARTLMLQSQATVATPH